MTNTTISLERLLELDVARTWPEVVAVAMSVGDAMRRAGTALTADVCVISVTGEVAYAGKGAPFSEAGAALAQILAALLDGQAAPPELRALADTPLDTSGDPLETLLSLLAYYERPGLQAEVAALAARAVAAEAEYVNAQELNRLRSGQRPGRVMPNLAIGPSARRTITVAFMTTVVGGVLVAVAAWYLARPAPLAPPPVAQEAPAASDPATPVSSLLSAASDAARQVTAAGLRAMGLVPASSDAAPPAPPSAPAPRRTRPDSAGAPASAPSVVANATPVAAVPPTDSSLPVVAADPANVASADLADAFTSGNLDVDPPMLVYPQLPTEPGAAPPTPSEPHFELLVNESGEVEHVRLRAKEVSYQNRMMVSAVKAWRFRPATKDGVPVRYRIRLPLAK
jgi:hypothetical protein